MHHWTIDELVQFVQSEFAALADDAKAPIMQAYMKTDMPFYGIQKPFRVPVYRALKKHYPVASQARYKETVQALWKLEHREERYAAIHVASIWKKFINTKSLPLYRTMIVDGAWWDFVDPMAIDLVGGVLRNHTSTTLATFDKWIDHKDMWLRRTAIIGQIKMKEETDERRLFDYCIKRMHEKEFFIRKAIGWALRSHSYIRPEAVMSFLEEHRGNLSGLSYREGAKQLVRQGLL